MERQSIGRAGYPTGIAVEQGIIASQNKLCFIFNRGCGRGRKLNSIWLIGICLSQDMRV